MWPTSVAAALTGFGPAHRLGSRRCLVVHAREVPRAALTYHPAVFVRAVGNALQEEGEARRAHAVAPRYLLAHLHGLDREAAVCNARHAAHRGNFARRAGAGAAKGAGASPLGAPGARYRIGLHSVGDLLVRVGRTPCAARGIAYVLGDAIGAREDARTDQLPPAIVDHTPSPAAAARVSARAKSGRIKRREGGRPAPQREAARPRRCAFCGVTRMWACGRSPSRARATHVSAPSISP